jgi:hypothetical protein
MALFGYVQISLRLFVTRRRDLRTRRSGTTGACGAQDSVLRRPSRRRTQASHPLQIRQAIFGVIHLTGIDCLLKDGFGGPQPNSCWYRRVDHDLENGFRSGSGSILQLPDSLTKDLSARLPAGGLELWYLHPPAKRVDANSHRAGGILYISVRKQRSNRLLHLLFESSSVL